jgi:D-beta-D-heptose 7-phosphate kinase/D-beta-D-heptose 1-phosphate adenosyltransferase
MRLGDNFASILVVGDFMLDQYLFGETERISPEAPVPVVRVIDEKYHLGGAGNVVNNLIDFGADVHIATVLGKKDTRTDQLLGLLKQKGVETKKITFDQTRTTTKKTRILAKNHQMLRCDFETQQPISSESEKAIWNDIKPSIKNYQAIILSDYGKGVLTETLTQNIIKSANQFGVKVLIDPKGTDYSKYKGAFTLTPNKKEANEAMALEIKDKEVLTEVIRLMKEQYDLTYGLITLSEEGIALFDQELKLFPTMARKVFDVTGAGDTVIAALAYALTQNQTMDQAIEFANYAAGVVVGKIGAATATLEEIESYKKTLHKTGLDSKIVEFAQVESICKNHKSNGKKVVFTNGCFDILHKGHVSYLEEAKKMGDILILGLNTDASVRRLKGQGRPVNSEKDRAYVLAGLNSVDYVVSFDEDTPYELIKQVQPDILVKGADYEGKEVVGSDIAKEVKLIEFVEGKSTTQIIGKIQEQE